MGLADADPGPGESLRSLPSEAPAGFSDLAGPFWDLPPSLKLASDLRLYLWAHEDLNLGPLPCQVSVGLDKAASHRPKISL
jgi:hypothetical protein